MNWPDKIQKIVHSKVALYFLSFLLFCLIFEWTFSLTMIGATYFDFHLYGKITNIIRPFLFLILLVSLFEEKKYSIILYSVIFFLICTVSHAHSKQWMLFDLFLLPFFVVNFFSVKRFLNFLFYYLILFSILFFIVDYLGLSPRFEYSRFYKGVSISREALGFGHPNTVGYLLMVIGMIYVLKKTVIKQYDAIFLFGISAFCFFVPNSVTTSFIVFLLGLFCLFYKDNLSCSSISFSYKRVFLISVCSVVFFIIMIWMIAFTGIFKSIILSISDTLWARFYLGYEGVYKYGIKLFGQSVDFLPEHGGFPIDCTYFITPIVDGLLSFLFFIVLYSIALTISICKLQKKNVVILLLCLLYGVSEYIGRGLFMFLFLQMAYCLINIKNSTISE